MCEAIYVCICIHLEFGLRKCKTQTFKETHFLETLYEIVLKNYKTSKQNEATASRSFY